MAELPTQRDFEDYTAWSGRDVLTSDGDRLGAVDVIFLDEATDLPEWVLVRLDDGDGSAFVPLAGASVEERAIRVDPDRERVASAPRIDVDETLSVADERRLYEHYGLPHSQAESASVLPEGAATGDETTQPEPAEERPRLRRYAGATAPPAASPEAAAEGAPPAPPAGEAAPTGAGAATTQDSTAEQDAPAEDDVPTAAAATAGAPADPDRTDGPSPSPSDGPKTTGTGATDPAPAPLPPPAPTPIPAGGDFGGGTSSGGADTESGGPLGALKRRPAIPVALASAIAGLVAVLALRRRR